MSTHPIRRSTVRNPLVQSLMRRFGLNRSSQHIAAIAMSIMADEDGSIWVVGPDGTKRPMVSTGTYIRVQGSHPSATDERGTASPYDSAMPFATLQAAVNAAQPYDEIRIGSTVNEDVLISNKSLSIKGENVLSIIQGTITTTTTATPMWLLFDDVVISNASGSKSCVVMANDDSTPVILIAKGGSMTSDAANAMTIGTGQQASLIDVNVESDLGISVAATGDLTLLGNTIIAGTVAGSGTTTIFAGVTVEDVQTSTIVYPENGPTFFKAIALPGPYADDAAAATAGIELDSVYRKTGGTVVWRQA